MNTKLASWLYILPALAIITFIFFFPVTYAFILSFFRKPYFTSEISWVGFDNYKIILNKPYFNISLLNTLIYGFGAVLIKATLGLCVALFLNRKFIGQGFLRAIVVLPWAIPVFAVCVIFWFVYDFRGIGNIFLRQLGIPPHHWLGEQSAMPSVILVNVWKGWPFFFLGFITGLQAIPNELYEAADVDGASPIRKLTSITLPLLVPVIVTVVILSLIWTMADFTTIYMLTGGGPLDRTLTIPMSSYKVAFFSEQNLSLASAYNILMLPLYLFLIYILLRRLTV